MRGSSSVLVVGALAALLLTVDRALAQTVLRVNFTLFPGGAANFTGPTALQDALAAAATLAGTGENVEVWVRSGTYTPGATRSSSFVLRSRVAILGGFNGVEQFATQRNANSNQVILSGDLLGNDVSTPAFGNRTDNAYHVVTAGPDADATAVLDGVRIERGSADGTGTDAFGGGIYVNDGSPTIRNFRIDGCQAVFGGGIYVSGEAFPRFSGAPINFGSLPSNAIPNAEVKFCRAITTRGGLGGGVFNQSFGLVRFEQVGITANGSTNAESQSGGVHNVGNITLARCIFSGNVGRFSSTEFYGGAVDSRGASAVTNIVGCWFVNNSGRGVACVSGSGGVLNVHNALFVNNFSNNGGAGAVYSAGATLNVAGCTFYSNNISSTGFAAGVTVSNSAAVISNSIFWRSMSGGTTESAASVRTLTGNPPQLISCTIQNYTAPYTGSGLETTDPAYTNPNGNDNILATFDDNFRLPPGSACINTGDNTRVPPDVADLDGDGNFTEPLPMDFYGNPRIVNDFTGPVADPLNPSVDRGCAESNTLSALWLGAAGSGGGIFDRADDWQNLFLPGPLIPVFFNQAAGRGTGNNISLAYTLTLGSSQSAYLMNVSANRVTLNLRSGTQNGQLAITAPASSPEPGLVISRTDPLGFTPRFTLDNTAGPLLRRTLTVTNATVARDLASRGELFVQSRRAELVINGLTEIGRFGSGAAVVQQQGLLSAQSLRLGTQANASGSLTIGADVNNTQAASVTYGGPGTEIIIGDRGNGVVAIGGVSTPTVPRAPGRLEPAAGPAVRIVLGREVTGQGIMNLVGRDTEFVADASDFIIGARGRATLTLSERAKLTSTTAAPVIVAQEAGSLANITLGAGSLWLETQQGIALGGAGEAHVDVGAGAEIIAAGPIRIGPNCTVTGEGSIRGNVVNVGRVRPGNTPGVLTIDGDYDQVSADVTSPDSGTLEMEVDALTEGGFDQLLVSGRANLGGGVIVTAPASGFPAIPPAGLDVTLVRADGGFAGDVARRFDVAFLPPLRGADANRFLRVAYGGPEGTAGIVRLLSGTLESGIAAGAPANTRATGTPSSALATDLDQDGLADLALTVPGDNTLVVLMNLGVINDAWQGFAGPVQLTVGSNPQGVAAGDIDADGRPDLVVANRGSASVSLFQNTSAPGGHAFTSTNRGTLATGATPTGVAIANFDGSGTRPVIVTGDETAQGASILIRIATPGFNFQPRINRPLPSFAPIQPRPIDIDGEGGQPSLALLTTGGSAVLILRNVSVGPGVVNFEDAVALPVGQGPTDYTIARLRDGRSSIVTANRAAGTLSVLVNTSDAANPTRFAPAVDLPAGIEPRSIVASDLDQDGDADLAVVTDSGTGGPNAVRVRLFRNDYVTDGVVNDQVTLVSLQDLPDPEAPDDPIFVVAGPLVDPASGDLITLTGAGGLRGPGGSGGPGGLESGNVRPRLNASTLPPPPPPDGCPLDFNNDGLVTGDDLGDFITAYFEVPPLGDVDFNNDGLVTPDDIDDFISAYFDPPC